MLVVADSSPLIVLIKIRHVDLLPELFGQIVIPPQVSSELLQSSRPRPVRRFMASPPGWLVERLPITLVAIPSLHAGEVAAISLALELNADWLLIDDKQGRHAARDRHIPLTGTIGILEMAADQGLVDLSDAFAQVKRTDFWISPRLLDERLRIHLARRGGGQG